MTGTAGTVVAVLAGLGAGWAFGTGVALQSRQARLAPAAGKGQVRLLAHLARQRLWLAGIVLATSAYGLQALALALASGPLALVAPVTATDLLFALPLTARWALAGLLITGMLLSASMLQAGALSASLPVIDTVEPVTVDTPDARPAGC